MALKHLRVTDAHLTVTATEHLALCEGTETCEATQYGIIDEEHYGWQLAPHQVGDSLVAEFKYEDSGNCDGPNYNIQSGFAVCEITFAYAVRLHYKVWGLTERQNGPFDYAFAMREGGPGAVIHGTQEGMGCAMGYHENEAWENLNPGTYRFQFIANTRDELFHVGMAHQYLIEWESFCEGGEECEYCAEPDKTCKYMTVFFDWPDYDACVGVCINGKGRSGLDLSVKILGLADPTAHGYVLEQTEVDPCWWEYYAYPEMNGEIRIWNQPDCEAGEGTSQDYALHITGIYLYQGETEWTLFVLWGVSDEEYDPRPELSEVFLFTGVKAGACCAGDQTGNEFESPCAIVGYQIQLYGGDAHIWPGDYS